jgi:hypothetical protein
MKIQDKFSGGRDYIHPMGGEGNVLAARRRASGRNKTSSRPLIRRDDNST